MLAMVISGVKVRAREEPLRPTWMVRMERPRVCMSPVSVTICWADVGWMKKVVVMRRRRVVRMWERERREGLWREETWRIRWEFGMASQ